MRPPVKKGRPLWKKLLITAAVAFCLGLLPYIWGLLTEPPFTLDHGNFIFSAQVNNGLAAIWALLKRYGPYLLTLYIITIAVLIFFEGQNPDRTVLWLLTLALLPVVGLIFYTLLGPDMKQIKNKKRFRPESSYPCVPESLTERTPSEVKRLSILAYRNSGSDIRERGAVKPLIDGEETFSHIKTALKDAKRYINIEYFIFKDDELGREIAAILCERAEAGVRVRMITDGVGSRKLGRKLVEKLRGAGVDARTFMPVSFPFFHSSINFRNHRKIIVVDGDVAFTGGLNIGVEYLGLGPLGFWRDTHAMFEGDMAYSLNAVFIEDWNFCAAQTLSPDDPEFAPTNENARWGMPIVPMQLVASGSSSVWHAIEQLYFGMITEAQRRIWITTPYLVPGGSILNALKVAALSGVDVRLLIPAKSDHFLVYWAGRANVEDLLRSGVRVWRYTKGFVHAKTLLMDDTLSSVGTANLDVRSLEINFEVQAFIYDGALNRSFASQFLTDIEDAEECVLHEWEKRGVGVRTLESLGRLWSSQI